MVLVSSSAMFNFQASPYSPFFTSGLLSDHLSEIPIPIEHLGPRRGSLPTDSLSCPSSKGTGSTDRTSAYYTTMQQPRNTQEFRSFLSLDLAESQSLRTSFQSKLKVPTTSTRLSVPPIQPTTSHSPRERTFPSPKPAPSSSLPAIPRSSTDHPSKLTTFYDIPAMLPASAISKASPLAALRASRQDSTTSTKRKFNRSDALACLEGRAKTATRVPRRLRLGIHRKDFINLGDDDDETASLSSLVMDEDFVLVPLSIPSVPLTSPSSPTLGLKALFNPKNTAALSSFVDFKDEDSSSWNWRSFVELHI